MPFVLLLALLIRLIAAFSFPNIIVPDEVFQFLEQAHRLVFGQGIVPWEYQVGLRNWLIPLMLAAPMALVHLFTPNPLPGLLLIRALLCTASLAIVWAGVKWGEQSYGQRGAWIAGSFTAIWPDLWIMAPHPLEESLAADALVPAIYLLGVATSLRRVAYAALLLGLSITFREQLAPAAAVAVFALCKSSPRRWIVALAAACLPLLCAGALDWASWGQPFRSFWLNIQLNVFLGILADHANPPDEYLRFLILDWLWTLPVLLVLAWLGAKRLVLPLVLAAIILFCHSIITHKEFRYIFPAIALLIPVAGVGLAKIFARLHWPRLKLHHAVAGAALLLGPLCSPWAYYILQQRVPSYHLFEKIAAATPCLVAVGVSNDLPFDILFTSHTAIMALEPFLADRTTSRPDVIVAMRGTIHPPLSYHQSFCAKDDWIPFGVSPYPGYCAWYLDTGTCRAPADAPPFAPAFPQVAKPFIIRDRLTG